MKRFFTPIQQTGMPGYQRHWLIMALCFGTQSLVLWSTYAMLTPGGITFLEGTIMFATFVGTLHPASNFGSAIIGIIVMFFGNMEKSIFPYYNAKAPLPELRSRTALTIFMRNEDPSLIFRRLLAMHQSLAQIGYLQHFRFVLLSDTSLAHVKCLEDEGFACIKDKLSTGTYKPCFYRRREKNIGYKGGNMHDYAENYSKDDEFFVPLDSDSVMGGDMLVRIVSSMEKYPQIGLIQPAFVCVPSVSAYARLQQFSSRYWMPVNYLGLSWWAHDCGLFWGHNAIIRTKVFREHCKLPIIPGKPPFGGHILGHDTIEAMLIRHAGYECRQLPIITSNSYEAYPPNLIEALKRQTRWFQCAMQYLFFLKEPGLRPINRFQLARIISQHLGPVAWLVIIMAFLIRSRQEKAITTNFHIGAFQHLLILVSNIFPRVAGVLAVVATPSEIQRYGGVFRFTIAVVMEFLFTSLMRASSALSITIFFCGLLFGKSISWDAQNRDQLGLSWRYTFRLFWVEILVGVGMICIIVTFDALRELKAFAISLLLVVPITVLSASPQLGRIFTRLRLFTTPEENPVPPLIHEIVVPEIILCKNK